MLSTPLKKLCKTFREKLAKLVKKSLLRNLFIRDRYYRYEINRLLELIQIKVILLSEVSHVGSKSNTANELTTLSKESEK